MVHAKQLGGEGLPRVHYVGPKPPRVEDGDLYMADPPPEISERCKFWLEQIAKGWRPNKRIRTWCGCCSHDEYGVYVWEFQNLICVALANGRFADYDRWKAEYDEKVRLRTSLGPLTSLDTFKADLKEQLRKSLQEELDRQILG